MISIFSACILFLTSFLSLTTASPDSFSEYIYARSLHSARYIPAPTMSHLWIRADCRTQAATAIQAFMEIKTLSDSTKGKSKAEIGEAGSSELESKISALLGNLGGLKGNSGCDSKVRTMTEALEKGLGVMKACLEEPSTCQ